MADGKIIIETDIDNSGIDKGLGETNRKVKTLGSIASGGFMAFTGAVVATGAAVTALGGVVAGVGMKYEAQMSRVKAISGATNEEFKKLNEQAKQLGATTSFSATEAAQGMENLASAGFETNEIMQAMPGMLDLAASSGEDLATSSDIAATTLRGFNLEASKAGHVADVLAANAAKTNASVASTGEAMKYVSTAASMAGLSLEEITASIGIMANAGVQGSQAGTTLRSALSRLASPSKEAAAAMSAMGFNAYDSTGKMKPLATQIEELKKGMAGYTDEQKQNALATIYGQESMSGMMALISAGPEQLRKLTQEYQNSDGAAQQMAATMKDNLKGSIEELGGAAETLAINLYENVDNPMKNVVKSATGMVQQLSNAFSSGGFAGLTSEIGNVIGQIITNIAAQAPSFINMGITIIQNLINGIQTNLPTIVNSAMQIVSSLINAFITLLPQLLQMGFQVLIMLGQGILQAIPTMIPTILQLIISLCDMITANLPQILQIAIQIIVALVNGLVAALPTLIAEVPRIINEFCTALFGLLPTIIAAAAQIIWALISGLIQNIPNLVANIPQLIMAIVNVISLFSWAGVGKSMILKIGEGITGMKSSLISIGQSIAEGTGNMIKNVFSGGLSWGKGLISSIGEGISGMGSYLSSSASSIATGALNAIKGAFSGGIEIGKHLITGIWNGISDMKSWILDKIGGFAGSIIGGIKGFFDINSPSRVMRDLIGVNIVKGIGVGIDKETPTLSSDIDTNMSQLVSRMQGVVNYETARTTAGVVAQNNKTIGPMSGVAQTSTNGVNKGTIEIPVIIEGREIARAVAPYQSEFDDYLKGR